MARVGVGVGVGVGVMPRMVTQPAMLSKSAFVTLRLLHRHHLREKSPARRPRALRRACPRGQLLLSSMLMQHLSTCNPFAK